MNSSNKPTKNFWLLLPLLLLLTSCVDLKGKVAISSSARLTGELNYSIDKSLASGTGINSFSEFKKQAEENPGDLNRSCSSLTYSEDNTNYKMNCIFTNSMVNQGDLQAKTEGGQVILTFKVNSDAEKDSSKRTDFGTIDVEVTFSDPVIQVSENKSGLVRKLNDKSYKIYGYATEPMDIKIIACSSNCTSTSVSIPSRVIDAKSATEAASHAIDVANIQTDVANLVAEVADASTVVAEYVRETLDRATTAVQTRNSGTFPIFDKTYVQSNLESLQSRKDNFEKRKVSLDAMAKFYDEAGAVNESYKRISSSVKRSLSDVERGITFANRGIELLRSLESELLKQKNLLNAPVATPTPNSSRQDVPAKTSSKSITCIKGKTSLKVIGKNPKCPQGYKKK